MLATSLDKWCVVPVVHSSLCNRCARRAAHTHTQHPDADTREVGSECYRYAEGNSTALGLDKGYYDMFVALDATGTITSPPDAVRYLKQRLQEFQRNGVSTSEATRQRLATLGSQMTQIGEQFELNINSDVRKLTVSVRAKNICTAH